MEPEIKERLKKVLEALRETQKTFRVAHSEMNMLRRAEEYSALGRKFKSIWESLENAREGMKEAIHTIEEMV